MAKYRNKKVITDEGVFDSQKEYNRWVLLKAMLRAGEIYALERQVKYVLIHAQRGPDVVGARGGRKPGKLLERECSYKADFVYKTKDGKTVVEDAKGVRTEAYLIKRKLMLKEHGIQVVEV